MAIPTYTRRYHNVGEWLTIIVNVGAAAMQQCSKVCDGGLIIRKSSASKSISKENVIPVKRFFEWRAAGS